MNRQWRPSFARRLFGSASWWRRSRQRRQLRPNSIGSRRVVESSYPGRLVPQRHRRCLRVLILKFALPKRGLNRPPLFRAIWGMGIRSFRPFKQWFDYIALGHAPRHGGSGAAVSGRVGREHGQEVAVYRAAPLLERNVTRRFPIPQPLVRALPRESHGPPELLWVIVILGRTACVAPWTSASRSRALASRFWGSPKLMSSTCSLVSRSRWLISPRSLVASAGSSFRTGTKSRWSRESSRHCVAAVATAVRGPPSSRAISPKTSFAPTSLSTTSLPPFAGTLILTRPETTARSPSPGSPLANIVAPTG